MRPSRGVSLCAGVVFVVACASGSSAGRERPAEALGDVDFPISCSTHAQREFNHAVALLHHMTYQEARTAFHQIAAQDSSCAMAYWGEALTLFQPVWPTRPGPADLALGWQLVQKARAARPATARETLFVAAAAAFFENPTGPDYWDRIRRWEAASERAHAELPNDIEAAAFYALAHLAVAQVASDPRSYNDRAAALVDSILARNPNHPGAIHYLIHADDIAGRESASLGTVAMYDHIAPQNPHALHMPTHIYVRLGDWQNVIAGNLKAADAALLHPAGDHGQYVWDEFPHAIEYLEYAYLQRGADDSAHIQMERLRNTQQLEPTFKSAFHLASTSARYALERHQWQEAVALPPREQSTIAWDRYPWAEAIIWFARGLGAAQLAQPDRAKEAERRLAELRQNAERAGEKLFVSNINVLQLGLSAWIAQSSGDAGRALGLMRQAVELEAATPKHPVTPAPTIPALELLGDLLSRQQNAAAALDAYEQSLKLYPNRFNSVLGAARAARATGDSARSTAYYRQLRDLAAASTTREGLTEARTFVGSPRD